MVWVLFVAKIGFSGFGGAGELGADIGDDGLGLRVVGWPGAWGGWAWGWAAVALAFVSPVAAVETGLVGSWWVRCRVARAGVGGSPAGRGKVPDRGWGLEARVAGGTDDGFGDGPCVEVVDATECGEDSGGVPAWCAGGSAGDRDGG